VRNGNDDVALFDSRSHQSKTERIRTTVDANAESGLAELCKVSFEFFDHRAADESCRLERPFRNCEKFLLQLLMRRNKIEKWNLRVV